MVELQMDTIVVRAEKLAHSQLDDDLVIFSVENGQYYGTQIVGRRIWELLEKPIRIATICDCLVREFIVAQTTCEQEVIAFLGELYDNNLLRIRS